MSHHQAFPVMNMPLDHPICEPLPWRDMNNARAYQNAAPMKPLRPDLDRIEFDRKRQIDASFRAQEDAAWTADEGRKTVMLDYTPSNGNLAYPTHFQYDEILRSSNICFGKPSPSKVDIGEREERDMQEEYETFVASGGLESLGIPLNGVLWPEHGMLPFPESTEQRFPHPHVGSSDEDWRPPHIQLAAPFHPTPSQTPLLGPSEQRVFYFSSPQLGPQPMHPPQVHGFDPLIASRTNSRFIHTPCLEHNEAVSSNPLEPATPPVILMKSFEGKERFPHCTTIPPLQVEPDLNQDGIMAEMREEWETFMQWDGDDDGQMADEEGGEEDAEYEDAYEFEMSSWVRVEDGLKRMNDS